MNLELVIAGGLLVPLTQLFLERKRERRAADRAKLLVASELLHAQMMLRVVSTGEHWPWIQDLDVYLPTSAWREHRSSIVGTVREDLWSELVLVYVGLEHDRTRFAAASKITPPPALTADLAKGMKKTSNELGQLRRKLGLGGGWLDEIDDKLRLEP